VIAWINLSVPTRITWSADKAGADHAALKASTPANKVLSNFL